MPFRTHQGASTLRFMRKSQLLTKFEYTTRRCTVLKRDGYEIDFKKFSWVESSSNKEYCSSSATLLLYQELLLYQGRLWDKCFFQLSIFLGVSFECN